MATRIPYARPRSLPARACLFLREWYHRFFGCGLTEADRGTFSDDDVCVDAKDGRERWEDDISRQPACDDRWAFAGATLL